MHDDEKQNVQKLYYRIGEVSKLVGVETSVIRHWETEFPGLSPQRSKTGQRVYRQEHVQRLRLIRKLLREQGYTTRGARQVLRSKGLEQRAPDDPLVVQDQRMRTSLLEMRGSILQLIEDLEEEEGSR